MNKINGIRNGDLVEITLNDGTRKLFNVHIGDAKLTGNGDSIWLTREEFGNSVYLRKLPQKPLSIGIALFESKAELQHTLNNGEFYVA